MPYIGVENAASQWLFVSLDLYPVHILICSLSQMLHKAICKKSIQTNSSVLLELIYKFWSRSGNEKNIGFFFLLTGNFITVGNISREKIKKLMSEYRSNFDLKRDQDWHVAVVDKRFKLRINVWTIYWIVHDYAMCRPVSCFSDEKRHSYANVWNYIDVSVYVILYK